MKPGTFYKNTRIKEVVSLLHEQVYHLTECRDLIAAQGQFAIFESLNTAIEKTRVSVRKLTELDLALRTGSKPGDAQIWGEPGPLPLETSSPVEPLAFRKKE